MKKYMQLHYETRMRAKIEDIFAAKLHDASNGKIRMGNGPLFDLWKGAAVGPEELKDVTWDQIEAYEET